MPISETFVFSLLGGIVIGYVAAGVVIDLTNEDSQIRSALNAFRDDWRARSEPETTELGQDRAWDLLAVHQASGSLIPLKTVYFDPDMDAVEVLIALHIGGYQNIAVREQLTPPEQKQYERELRGLHRFTFTNEDRDN
jgi:hypothetical protein